MNHTPGPWFNEGSHVYTKQGAWYIAETEIERKSFTKRGAEAEANARLIAAAPDMLDVLEWILGHVTRNTLGTVELEYGTGTVVDAHLIKFKIRDALAKARGEVTP